ncbi:site-2 protease family protein [Haliangium ochraceum]|uniref:Peptidase M50 n=1 Tax=Haliangium ochraceum (strain DSM 14365 / JCM 11303 / SMP-2) TaxID=502025 RepID=D0LXP1_HALO1|nr:site-2 protease family protein [Haliangium ochraceum]ACY17796.1 peptidase M50 [Haliangium ochraceum DSM 14365]
MIPRLRSYRLGSLFGFPIEVNLSFLILLGVVFFLWGGLSGLLVTLIAFASVVLHELGHALVARRLSVPVVGIELHFFGGAAKMVGQPKRANDEVLIAAAGPAVSFALGAAGWVLASITGALGIGALHTLFQAIAWINLIVALFNLVPALPMDGGRILRALLTRKYPFERATEIAIKVARGFAIALAVYGVASVQLYMLLLAAFLWFLGATELHMARMMRHDFTYDHQGYRRYDHANDVVVMPPGAADEEEGYGVWGAPGAGRPFGFPGFGGPSGRRDGGIFSAGKVIVRRRGGRVVIEIDD